MKRTQAAAREDDRRQNDHPQRTRSVCCLGPRRHGRSIQFVELVFAGVAHFLANLLLLPSEMGR